MEVGGTLPLEHCAAPQSAPDSAGISELEKDERASEYRRLRYQSALDVCSEGDVFWSETRTGTPGSLVTGVHCQVALPRGPFAPAVGCSVTEQIPAKLWPPRTTSRNLSWECFARPPLCCATVGVRLAPGWAPPFQLNSCSLRTDQGHVTGPRPSALPLATLALQGPCLLPA